jgi:hypothetical protein
MAGTGEGTKKEREYQNPNQNPERGQQPGKQDDPSWKRNKPDQYNEDQGSGLPPVEQAAGRQGTQTGHEDPRSGSGQHQGAQQGGQHQGGQQGQKGNPQQQQQGGKRPGESGSSERGEDRGEGHKDSAQKWDVQDRDRNKSSETEERGVKQGQKH